MGLLALLLYLSTALLSRWAGLRRLDAERRLRWMAGLCLLALLLLRILAPAVNASILAGESPPIHQHLLLLATGLGVALALGLSWSAALDDSRPGLPRAAFAALFLLPLAGTLVGATWTMILAIPVAVRTGWSRTVAEQRRPPAALAGLAGFAAVLAWPGLQTPASGVLTSGGPAGITLFGFARLYLLVQLGLLALRYILGLIFGPRRIGRRLLVSHMLAGLVPVALLSLLASLIAVLALADFRARSGSHLLTLQHRVSEEALARCVTEALDELGIHRDGPTVEWTPALLSQLAAAVRTRWPATACWEPSDMPAQSAGPDYIHVAFRTSQDGFALMDRARSDDPLFVPVYAWLTRPADEAGCGLVKTRGSSLHVTDHRVAIAGTGGDSTLVRVQVIERLPFGRVRVLEERLDHRASIEEEFRYRLNERGGLEFVSADRAQDDRPEDGAERAALRRSSSLFNSGTGYRLMSAQEWIPADPTAADSLTRRPNVARLGEWGRIRLAVLGVAAGDDLVPALPTGGDPVAWFPIVILGTVMVVFISVESFAFLSAVRMGRSIAIAVSALRFGTERLRQGDLAHRIEIAGRDELATLGDAFNAMAVDLEAGRRTLLEKERLESELALARKIQQRLLPERPPEIPGLALAGVSVPAREVGGDYYDFLRLPDGRLLFVLADVSGKGAPAALLMSSVRASLHSLLDLHQDLGHLADRLNRFIHASTSTSEFVTLFFGVIDPASGRLVYINAGHEYPFLVRRDGRIERLSTGGLMMGAFAEARYEDATVELGPGDLLFLFTDGLTDALDARGEVFGEERTAAGLRSQPEADPESLLRTALQNLDGFVQGTETVDDITLLAIRRQG